MSLFPLYLFLSTSLISFIVKKRKHNITKNISFFDYFLTKSSAKYHNSQNSCHTNSAITNKKKLISSIFSEKIEFDGKKCRTTRINDVLKYILQIDKGFSKNKKGENLKKMSLSRVVETPRIELGSKQATNWLSTYLVLS